MRAALLLTGSPYMPATAPKTRRRFVQDGEVPVVVVNPRQPRLEQDDRGAVQSLQRQLVAERDARMNVERALQRSEDLVRQLQTRLAHAEIAVREAAAPPPVLPEAVATDEVAAETAPLPADWPEKPRRGRKPKSLMATDIPAEAELDSASIAVESDESVEWWKPNWREEFRKRPR
jgi:hypothetical protein